MSGACRGGDCRENICPLVPNAFEGCGLMCYFLRSLRYGNLVASNCCTSLSCWALQYTDSQNWMVWALWDYRRMFLILLEPCTLSGFQDINRTVFREDFHSTVWLTGILTYILWTQDMSPIFYWGNWPTEKLRGSCKVMKLKMEDISTEPQVLSFSCKCHIHPCKL